MGLSRQTLSKIVNGKGKVTPELAIRLSMAF
jgi:plasmid maintenance system antidote protein VapI